MKKLLVLALLSISISVFAIPVKVEDSKYKKIDHTENQTYECYACNPLKFWLNRGSITPKGSTNEIEFNFDLTDRKGEYRSSVEYYFGKNVYFDGKRYGENDNFWIAFDVVYPLSSKNEVCFLHSYTVKYYSKVTESWEPETYTELVFVGKDTQKKRITYKFKDPDRYVYKQVYQAHHQAVQAVTATMIAQLVMVPANARYAVVREYKTTVTRLPVQGVVNVAVQDYAHLVVVPKRNTELNRVV